MSFFSVYEIKLGRNIFIFLKLKKYFAQKKKCDVMKRKLLDNISQHKVIHFHNIISKFF